MHSVLRRANLATRAFSSKASRNVVIVDGTRIPFSLAGMITVYFWFIPVGIVINPFVFPPFRYRLQ